MLLIGGFQSSIRQSNIWELNEEWTKIGNLKSVMLIQSNLNTISFKGVATGSAIRIGKSIFVYPGFGNDVQRIDLTQEEEIESIDIIGTHSQTYIYPILLATSNTCQQ